MCGEQKYAKVTGVQGQRPWLLWRQAAKYSDYSQVYFLISYLKSPKWADFSHKNDRYDQKLNKQLQLILYAGEEVIHGQRPHLLWHKSASPEPKSVLEMRWMTKINHLSHLKYWLWARGSVSGCNDITVLLLNLGKDYKWDRWLILVICLNSSI